MTIATDGMPLLERTLHLVRNAPRSLSYAEMARQIEASPAWVQQFAKGAIPNPGVITVQRLHDYLANVGN